MNLGCLTVFRLGVAELQTFAASHQECIPMPDMMLHFLEQADIHLVQLKEKDDEIARLCVEVESLKLSEKFELEKVDQEFFEEKNQLSLQLQKDKELLDAAKLKNQAMTKEITRFAKNKANWALDLQKMLRYIHREFLYLVESFFACTFS